MGIGLDLTQNESTLFLFFFSSEKQKKSRMGTKKAEWAPKKQHGKRKNRPFERSC